MVALFLKWCERFLAADDEAVGNLQQQGFVCVDGGWNFTLPQLHQFLVAQMSGDDAPSYPSFRQQLFNSPVNAYLGEKQAEIAIVDNAGKVDLSTYRLQRVVKVDGPG